MIPAIVRVGGIHNPVLRGPALLLWPEGLLVRWPDRTPLPVIGAVFVGRVVEVPPELAETVRALLFSQAAIERCEAARRLAETKQTRARILLRIFSKPYVQQLLAAAKRLTPEVREHLSATGERISVHRLARAAYKRTPSGQLRKVTG